MNRFDNMSKDAMARVEEIMNSTKLNEFLHRKEEEEKKKTCILWVLAIIGVVAAVAAAAVVSFGADEQPANNAEPSAAARIIEIAFFLIILYLSFLYCESIFMLYLRLYLHFTYFLVVFMFFALASAASYDYVHKYCNNYDNTDYDISDSNRCSCKLKTIL